MNKEDGVSWARLGRVEKAFLLAIPLYALLYFAGAPASAQFPVAVAGIFLGIATLVRLARSAMRNLIWRLRNRLIVAYLFIAVVPIVLILVLLAGTAYLVVGQIAGYLAYTDLMSRMRFLSFPAEAMVRVPARDPQAAINRLVLGVKRVFPAF